MITISNTEAPTTEFFENLGFDADPAYFLCMSSFATHYGKPLIDQNNVVWDSLREEVKDEFSNNSRDEYILVLAELIGKNYPKDVYKDVICRVVDWEDMAIVPSVDHIVEALSNQFPDFNVKNELELKTLVDSMHSNDKTKKTLPTFMASGDVIISNPFLSPTELFTANPIHEYGIENFAKWALKLAKSI